MGLSPWQQAYNGCVHGSSGIPNDKCAQVELDTDADDDDDDDGPGKGKAKGQGKGKGSGGSPGKALGLGAAVRNVLRAMGAGVKKAAGKGGKVRSSGRACHLLSEVTV